VIVLTGPGRTGTSVLARLYRELGFDPGGLWHPEINAGLEEREVMAANVDMATELGMAFIRARLAVPRRMAPAARLTPTRLRRKVYGALARRRPPQLLQWDRFDVVVDRYRDRLVSLAADRQVVKDPRFCWTLPVWLAAGAPIEYVVITLRDLPSMVASRTDANHSTFGDDALRNSLVYSVGMATLAVHEHRLPHTILRFPDFLEDPRELHRVLRFPSPVPPEKVAEVLQRLHRPDLVHHGV
jgi:hypothetical protein